jgi:plastocyanin
VIPMKLGLLALDLILVVLVAGGIAIGQPGREHAHSATAAPHSHASGPTVSMAKSYRFEPALIEVPAGATLTWLNDDNFTHNVKLSGGVGVDWTSPTLRPGESTGFKFEAPGTYEYLCVFHSQNMRARVVVLPKQEPEGEA